MQNLTTCPNEKDEFIKNLIILVAGLGFLVMSIFIHKVDLEAEKAHVKTVVDQLEQFLKTENMELF